MTSIVGVICPVCSQEAFQLLEREAHLSAKTTVIVKCCRRCAYRIDSENEEQTEEETLRKMNKSQRLLHLQRLSRQWAQKLNGEQVIVFFDKSTHPMFCNSSSRYQVRGVAERTSYVRKWGQVQVTIASEETHRIVETKADFPGGSGAFLHYSIDIPWGLWVRKEFNNTWITEVSWGARNSIALASAFDPKVETS